jgi:hypothetical protein
MNTQARAVHFLVVLATPCVLAVAAPAEAASSSPPVRLNPRITLSAVQAARLQAAADQGMTALRRYVWRTRTIYNYLISDLI